MWCSFRLNYRTNITIYRERSFVKTAADRRRRSGAGRWVMVAARRRRGRGAPRPRLARDVAIGQDHAAQDHDVAVGQLGFGDAPAVDERAVGAAVVQDPRPAGTLVNDGVAPRDALVVEAHV